MAVLKTFSDIMNELSMKSDKKLPNLRVPVKGPKGTSKYSRMKVAYHNAPGAADIKKAVNASVQSADRKPERYTKPDGKIGIRMVKVDKEVIKQEAVTPGYMAHMKKVNKNKEYAYPNRGKGKPVSQETKDKMFGKKPKKTNETIVDPNDLKGRPKKADPNPESPYGIKHPMHPANLKNKKVKSEASSPSVLKPTKPSDITKHARTLAKSSDDYERNKKKYIDKARSKVFKMYPRESLNGLMKEGTPGAKLHPIAQYVRDKEKRLKNKEGTPGANDADMKHHYMYHDDAKAARAHATKVGGKVIKGSGKRGPEYSVKYKNKNYKESVDQLDEKMNPFTKVLKKNRKLISNDHVTTHRNNKFYVIIDDEELNALSTMDSESIFISLKKNKGIGYTENDLTAYFKTAKDANQFVKDIKGPRYSNNRQFDVVGESVNEATWPDEMPPETHHKDCGTEACCGECVEETADTDTNEALNMSQRIKRSRLMKRMKGRIMVGRRRAKKKMANKGTLEKRSMRQARNELAKKLTRGVPKSELTFARKQEIEKRLEKPALQQRIKRLAKRKFKDVRKKEVERKKG